MLFDNVEIKWLKNGGEVDMPRDPDDWNRLAYRSIRWNPDVNRFDYFIRGEEGKAGSFNWDEETGQWVPEGRKEEVIHSFRSLDDLIRVTNQIHQIDDEVVVEDNS